MSSSWWAWPGCTWSVPGPASYSVAFLCCCLGWACGRREKRKSSLAASDPGQVVIDEVVGQMLTFLLVPHATWKWLLGGFLLFRAFDIVKPFPARQAERIPRGWGIMIDDAVAGLYALAVLTVLKLVYAMSLWRKTESEPEKPENSSSWAKAGRNSKGPAPHRQRHTARRHTGRRDFHPGAAVWLRTAAAAAGALWRSAGQLAAQFSEPLGCSRPG